MSDHDLPPPLPEDIVAMLRAEHRAPPVSAATRDQIAMRLQASLGVPVVPPGATATASVVAGAGAVVHATTRAKVFAVIVGAVAVSGGAWWYVSSRSHKPASPAPMQPMDAPQEQASTASVNTVASPREVAVVRDAGVVPVSVARVATVSTLRSSNSITAPTVRAQPSVAPSAPAHTRVVRTHDEPSDEDLARERDDIAEARNAIAHQQGAAALRALERHQREFAHGRLTEEREALRVKALVLVGNLSQATQVAAQFRRRFPDSPLMSMVERAIEPSP